MSDPRPQSCGVNWYGIRIHTEDPYIPEMLQPRTWFAFLTFVNQADIHKTSSIYVVLSHLLLFECSSFLSHVGHLLLRVHTDQDKKFWASARRAGAEGGREKLSQHSKARAINSMGWEHCFRRGLCLRQRAKFSSWQPTCHNLTQFECEWNIDFLYLI